jgi:hypothetical protein
LISEKTRIYLIISKNHQIKYVQHVAESHWLLKKMETNGGSLQRKYVSTALLYNMRFLMKLMQIEEF